MLAVLVNGQRPHDGQGLAVVRHAVHGGQVDGPLHHGGEDGRVLVPQPALHGFGKQAARVVVVVLALGVVILELAALRQRVGGHRKGGVQVVLQLHKLHTVEGEAFAPTYLCQGQVLHFHVLVLLFGLLAALGGRGGPPVAPAADCLLKRPLS